MRTLDCIEAEGFKSIDHVGPPLFLQDLNVLIGANGAGKSNFLGLFKLLNQISEGNLQDYVSRCGGANALLRFGSGTTRYIKVELLFSDNARAYSCVLSPTVDDRLTPWGEFSPPPSTSAIREHLQSWRVYHFNDTAKVGLTQNVDDNRSLRPDGSNIASVLFLLKQRHEADYASIVDAIRMVFPFFNDFTLAPLELNPDTIKLEWREKGSDSYLNASALSDGTLRFICLSTLLLQPNLPSLLLVDEPELGLHPYAINVLAGLLRGAATKTQVIVSTQSVTLVNQFEPEELIVVERAGGKSVFRRLEKAEMESWLDEYGLGDLWEKNVIGGRP
jgi:predicted ATPase